MRTGPTFEESEWAFLTIVRLTKPGTFDGVSGLTERSQDSPALNLVQNVDEVIIARVLISRFPSIISPSRLIPSLGSVELLRIWSLLISSTATTHRWVRRSRDRISPLSNEGRIHLCHDKMEPLNRHANMSAWRAVQPMTTGTLVTMWLFESLINL
jgi:hypothetical protein